MDELASYDYHLPPELIAAEPLPERDRSRMLVVDRANGIIRHSHIRDLPETLRSGDRLVLNDTQVVPARLFGSRTTTGGKWEGLFLDSLPTGQWRLIANAGGRLRAGDVIKIVPASAAANDSETANRPSMRLTLIERDEDGVWTANPSTDEPAFDVLRRFGTVPLPPYIGRKCGTEADRERYQTTFARRPGAVAAPTAGLHFTPELLARCTDRGIDRSFLTLHVGIGTFRPIAVERLSEHVMHREWCEVSEETCHQVLATREQGGRIVAVGTTSVRTLESASQSGALEPFRGETNLFIRPPYQFRTVDCLLTNFHLPRSTLLVLVSALAGFELIRHAYEEAIKERYRFYSYGDSMLIL
jgi:S-adenosylmethionine:tRNA ribosyltransferase-isomerase